MPRIAGTVGFLPAVADAHDYEPKTGAAFLPPIYAKWVASADNRWGNLVAIAGHENEEWRILSPADGLVVRLDPDLPGGKVLILRADAEVQWVSPTLRIVKQGANGQALLADGEHEIKASFQGKTQSVRIRVEHPR